jgi:hypothetical protein
MRPFPSLTGIERRLRRPAVRDLAWVLCSPSLLLAPWPLRHPLQGSRWWAAPQALEAWLLRLDRDDAGLQDWLARSPVRRLGLYYERLWQFALHAAPDVELLAANLPVREAGHTLGELDLLLRDRDGVHHLELAIKLYLGLRQADGRDPANWLGPGSADRLDLKLGHLDRHQLPLSATPQGRLALEALGVGAAQSSLWLAGYLFYPWPDGGEMPEGGNPQHLCGRWLSRGAWPRFASEAGGGRWQPLPRSQWLAAACIADAEAWSSDAFDAWLAALPPDASPKLLARLQADASGDWIETERVFLVPDGWPATPRRVAGDA